MTTHTPVPCAYSTMCQRGSHEVVLLNTGSYPGFSSYLNAVYTWNGTDWTLASTALVDGYTGPVPVRSGQVMSYDGYNVMLFGGQGGEAGVFKDTWEWSGAAPWVKQTPTVYPFGRYGAKAAYLSTAGVIMFGGFGGSGNGVYLNETWLWNGNTLAWAQQSPTTSPCARIEHVMAANSSEVIMFGGVNSAGQFLNDTWKYDGVNWTKLTPTTPPSVRGSASMSYDSINSIWVLFGGQNEYNYLPETWVLNSGATAWTKIIMTNGAGPLSSLGAQMCFDTQSGKTLLFGGVSAETNLAGNQSWLFDGSVLTWTQV